jgi:uncharacterized membrane protein YedE/YeeE
VTVDQTRPALTLRSVHLTGYTLYLLAGTLFGIIAYKSEIISWYRIQEMFRFDSLHMCGVIASAVLVAAVSVWLLKRLRPNSFTGEPISFTPKARTYPRYILGGTLFGIGWALTGACPGPVFALIGSGFSAFLIVLASAIFGTWTYGQLRAKLPH